MENKVLINLTVLALNTNYDLYLPVNERLWKIKRLLAKSLFDLSKGAFPLHKDFALINKTTGYIYEDNDIVIDTDIRNTTQLIIIEKRNI